MAIYYGDGSNSGSGRIIQVASTTKTDTTSTNSNSYVDISGMSVTLTPKSGTKCYVTYNIIIGGQSGGWTCGIQLLRDSTTIGNGSQYNANNFYCSRGGNVTDNTGYIHGGNIDDG